MKKLIMMIMALCLIVPAMNAELSKNDRKKVESMAKKRAKELEKQGYVVMGSLPLQNALEKHYELTMFGNAEEQQGNGRAKSKNNGRQMCLTSAMNEYATKQMSQIQGRSVTDQFGNEVNTADEAEFARFYAAFERLTQKEVQGELKESFTVYKQLPDGTYDFQMYMTLDPRRASNARLRAIEDAAVESGLAEIYAKQLSDFVKEGFSK